MKKILLLTALMMLSAFALPAQEKRAVLMVHFGTTYDDTRAKTIDAINARVQAAFPDYEFREAWTSRFVIRRLKARGVEKLTPLDALIRLRADGYTHVIVQSTTLLDGIEMASLRKDVAEVEKFFTEIRVGALLLATVEDCARVAEIMAVRHAAAADAKKKAHVILVGHGTAHPVTATYSQVDHLLKAAGHKQFHIATIEGYPTYDTALAELKAANAKSVTLVPLLFVAGDHANNDLAVEWKQALEAQGLKVSCIMEGLGEVPEIQELYLEHLRKSLSL